MLVEFMVILKIEMILLLPAKNISCLNASVLHNCVDLCSLVHAVPHSGTSGTFKGIQFRLLWMVTGKTFSDKKSSTWSLLPSVALWEPLLLFLIRQFSYVSSRGILGRFFENQFQIQELPLNLKKSF